MNRVLLGRVGAALALLTTCVTGGCGSWFAPPPDRYVGTWENAEDRLRIDRNGLGEGRVIRGRDPRPFTWEQGVDRITITFDGSKRPEVFSGRLDADGHLVVSSPRTSVTLERVVAPEPPATGAHGTSTPPAAPNETGARADAKDSDT